MKAFIKITKHLLKRESDLVLAARIKGIILVKPTAVFGFVIMLLYLQAGIDIFPEKCFPIFGCIDDVIILLASMAYLLMDIINVFATKKVDSNVTSETQELEDKTETEGEKE